jgi:hypothetical protein
MSVFGTKRTSQPRSAMSAFGGIADIVISERHVRFPKRTSRDAAGLASTLQEVTHRVTVFKKSFQAGTNSIPSRLLVWMGGGSAFYHPVSLGCAS